MKITIIGGGSTYSPELVEGLIEQANVLNLEELYLYDIDETRLNIVGGLVKRMVEAAGNPFKVQLSLNRQDAISGADFVLTQIRVGGQLARHVDTKICLAEDIIGQETTGPVGFAKAMRTIPVILDICKEIKEHAPNAVIINFTNPAGIITEAVMKHGDGVKVVGLCNVPYGIKVGIAEEYNVTVEDVEIDYVGLNHLSWVRKILVKGEDKTKDMILKTSGKPANIPQVAINEDFQIALGMRTNSYLDYFYVQDEMLKYLQSQEKTRAQIVSELEASLLEQYKDPDLKVKPQELEKRGGAHYSTVAISLVRDIYKDVSATHIVNVRNDGAIMDLPFDAVIEIPAVVNSNGAKPTAIGRLAPEIRGLIQHVNAYEELTVEAAVSRDYNKALLALSTNPLVTSVNKAKRILDRFNDEHNLGLQKN